MSVGTTVGQAVAVARAVALASVMLGLVSPVGGLKGYQSVYRELSRMRLHCGSHGRP